MPDPCAVGMGAPAALALPETSATKRRQRVTAQCGRGSKPDGEKRSGLGMGPRRCARYATASVGEPSWHVCAVPAYTSGAARRGDSRAARFGRSALRERWLVSGCAVALPADWPRDGSIFMLLKTIACKRPGKRGVLVGLVGGADLTVILVVAARHCDARS